MSFKIVLDSCGELTDEMTKSGKYSNVPLTLIVGDREIIDDETFDQADFLKAVASTPECPKSACPSPEQYIKAYGYDAERVYGVTLSANLSGSFNSAVLGGKLHKDLYPASDVYVFDSKSASAGETLIAMKIEEYENIGMSFDEIIEKVEEYVASLSTIFVLEDLGFLEKNGRLTGLKKIAANLLNIVPILAATDQGTIYQVGQARGIKKALVKLTDMVTEECIKKNSKKMVIAHCNCKDRALSVKEKLLEKLPDLKIYITDTRGVASLYAGNKGIIISFD